MCRRLAAEPGSPAATLALQAQPIEPDDRGLVRDRVRAFPGAGLPTVVCGPGSIDQAHKPDEFVEESQLAACLAFLDDLAGELSR